MYSGCSGENKRVLRKRLLELKLKFNNWEWVIGGDFNAVKNKRERVGSSSSVNSTEWRDFSSFIEGVDLVDVPCKEKSIAGFVEIVILKVDLIVS